MRISDWSSDVCSSDLFGPSMVYRDFSVTSLVAHGLPVSLTLGALALALALSIGIPLGCWAAWRRTGGADRSVLVTATLLNAVPTFVTAPLLVLVFGLALGWLPVRSEEHTSELQSLMRISYAVFCLKKK